MIFKPYCYFETGCAAYLFGCGGLGKCAVVDAHERDIDAYAEFAASKGMRITHVIDTHTVCGKGGGRSARAAELLRASGFASARSLCGGTEAGLQQRTQGSRS